jgi:hypothetical protein
MLHVMVLGLLPWLFYGLLPGDTPLVAAILARRVLTFSSSSPRCSEARRKRCCAILNGVSFL